MWWPRALPLPVMDPVAPVSFPGASQWTSCVRDLEGFSVDGLSVHLLSGAEPQLESYVGWNQLKACFTCMAPGLGWLEDLHCQLECPSVATACGLAFSLHGELRTVGLLSQWLRAPSENVWVKTQMSSFVTQAWDHPASHSPYSVGGSSHRLSSVQGRRQRLTPPVDRRGQRFKPACCISNCGLSLKASLFFLSSFLGLAGSP